jgi:ATP/maltotriose-dependent transcriptional regulator MalT/DNA-binding SARP family transcriptional activator
MASRSKGGAARTLAAKSLAPAVPSSALPRPQLESRLAEALRRRLTAVVAGAGFGKSTLLAAWAPGVNCSWYRVTPEDADLGSLAAGVVHALRLRLPGLPDEISAAGDALQGPNDDADQTMRAQAYAGLLGDALAERLHDDLVLVLDDVNELRPGGGAARFIETLCREAPASFHLVLASREDPPFAIDRLRGEGQVLEITGRELAFTVAEVEALLTAELGDEAAPAAGDIAEATGGWPAAVRLVIEALRTVSPDERSYSLARVRRPEGPLFAYLAAEVFEREPPETRELIRTVASLEAFTPELCAALGIDAAGRTLDSLARRGLFLELGRREIGWFSLSGLVREFVRTHLPLEPDELRNVHRRAARWLESQGHLEEALRALLASSDLELVATMLAEQGRPLLRAGALEAVIRAAATLPPKLRDPRIEEVEGAARQIRGDWEGALACFSRVAESAGELHPGMAWRMGLIHHFRGRLDEALDVYERARLDTNEPRDEALVLAWKASAHWLRGDAAACSEAAARALEVATGSGDPQSLAAAHTVLAMLAALDGDRGANDAHYLRALEHATQAGDLLQMIRIHTNRASLHLEEGSYAEALAELETSMRMANVTGFASFQALGLTNRGEARHRLGRLEEAIADYEAARRLYQRMGSRMVCYPLYKLGDVHRDRGDLALARADYEEAVALAQQANDLQGLVPALAGLARMLAEDEPDEAEALATRALDHGPGMGYVAALLAVGWVALARSERDRAAQAGLDAAAAARARRDRAGLAEALELQGRSAPSPAVGKARLDEALAVWRQIRDPLGEARTELALASVSDGRAARELAESAEARLRALGARGLAARAASLRATLDREAHAPVAVHTLGAFRVLRDGEPVPLAEWQSKKARDVLRILIARRGRAVPRDFLMETLWPEEDPAKLANRLSVALATVRVVLDPSRAHPAEHYVSADKNAIRLDLANVKVDVEAFLADATAGLALRRNGETAEAARRLAAAEAAYAGDFLEEDAYEDWATPLREEARAAYVRVARALAADAAAGGDHDAAGRYFLRILERDGHDEQAHLGLVSTLLDAGRHGEARRFFRDYCARMEEIGVEPAAFPAAGGGVALAH